MVAYVALDVVRLSRAVLGSPARLPAAWPIHPGPASDRSGGGFRSRPRIPEANRARERRYAHPTHGIDKPPVVVGRTAPLTLSPKQTPLPAGLRIPPQSVHACDAVLRSGKNRTGSGKIGDQCVQVDLSARLLGSLGEYMEAIAAVGQKAVDGDAIDAIKAD